MNIRRIGTQSVLRYDAFDLDFGEGGPALHILYGPNEAGKSTLLQLIVDLLFGGKIDDAYQEHYDARSRIEGIIEHPGLEPFHIQRKKRYSKLSLTDGVQTELSEELLLPYLGGYTKEQFTLLFGFDHDRLRYGGESLLQSGGHAGVSLFEAGGGVQYLQAQLKDLTERTNAMLDPSFGSRSAKQINKEWRAYKDAEKWVRTSGLRGEDWDRQRRDIDTKNKEVQQVQEQKLEKTREIRKLQRIQRVRNLIVERRIIQNRLQELSKSIILPAELDVYILDLIQRIQTNTVELEEKKDLYKKKQDFILTIPADLSVLPLESDIDALNEGLQQYQSRLKDEIPKAAAQLGERKAEATHILKKVAPHLGIDDVEQLRIPFAEEERIQEVTSRLKEAQNLVDLAQERYREAVVEHEIVEAERLKLGVPQDVSVLKILLQQIRSDGDLDEMIRNQQADHEQKRQSLEKTLHSQSIWTGTLQEVKGLSLPLHDTIQRFQQAWSNAENELTELTKDRNRIQDELVTIGMSLAELELGGQVPVEPELIAAREKRDQGWQIVKKILCHEHQDPVEVDQFRCGEDLHLAFETAMRKADHIADWMRKESDRSAKRAHLLLQREQQSQRLAQLEDRFDQKQKQFALLKAEWCNEWKSCGIHPKMPSEMNEWLATFFRPLLEGLHALDSSHRIYQSLLQRRDSYRMQLQEVISGMQVVLPQSDVGLHVLVQVCDGIIAEAEQQTLAYKTTFQKWQDFERKVHDFAHRLEQANKQVEVIKNEWNDIQQNYSLLPEDPEIAIRFIAQVRQLFQYVREAEQLQVGIHEKQEFCARFEREAYRLAEQLNENMDPFVSLEAWVRFVRDRLRTAKESAVRLDQMQKEAEEVLLHIQYVTSTAEQDQDVLNKYLQEYGCATLVDLKSLVHTSIEWKRVEQERNQIESRLYEAGDGLSVEQLEEEVDEIDDPDRYLTRLDGLIQEEQALEERLAEEQKQLWQLQHEFRKLDGSSHEAAMHAQKAESHLAEVDRLWNEYLRMELARRMLQHTIEQFRQQNESKVLDKASELFEALTLGKYKGLIVEYDGSDPYIQAIHSDGNKRRVTQMSDGTRDQLFLSLRLAFLNQHLTGTNALPLIMDDILVHFDDERTQATLNVLHDLAGKTQILYFTHHKSVVEIAQKLTDSTRVQIHELASYHIRDNDMTLTSV